MTSPGSRIVSVDSADMIDAGTSESVDAAGGGAAARSRFFHQ